MQIHLEALQMLLPLVLYLIFFAILFSHIVPEFVSLFTRRYARRHRLAGLAYMFWLLGGLSGVGWSIWKEGSSLQVLFLATNMGETNPELD